MRHGEEVEVGSVGVIVFERGGRRSGRGRVSCRVVEGDVDLVEHDRKQRRKAAMSERKVVLQYVAVWAERGRTGQTGALRTQCANRPPCDIVTIILSANLNTMTFVCTPSTSPAAVRVLAGKASGLTGKSGMFGSW